MRVQTLGNFLLGALTAGIWFPTAVQGNTCLMMFQMADNNLEYYIREDYEELANSDAIKNSNLNTWIYYDALDGGPLPGLYNSDGSAETDNYQGTRYIHYENQKMVINKELDGELNSDTQGAIRNFLIHAMEDCIPSGFTSLMAVFSSHGGGFAGFGGDEHPGRHLLQLNQEIVAAVRDALDAVANTPAKLDVIGFDACLMASFGAIDEYRTVAYHVVASEAVEPGHGWAYAALTQSGSALALAQDVVTTFVSEKQGGNHQSPKLLSITDTDKFTQFVSVYDEFFAELLTTIQDGDSVAHAYVGRARSASTAFEGIVDAGGTKNPSGLDIGSFLDNFEEQCSPGGDLGSLLGQARTMYTGMFIDSQYGEGTAAGTGMHVTWPVQSDYESNGVWDTVLFDNSAYASVIASNYLEFLKYHLTTSTPNGVGGDSICGTDLNPPGAVSDADPDALLYGPGVEINNNFVKFTADMNVAVDQVLVEYSVDLTTPLKDLMNERGYPPKDGDYLYLLGGDVKGNYAGSQFSADWNRDFYFLDVYGSATYEALYVFDQGNNAKNVPCLYFPEDRREDASEIAWLDFLFYDEALFTEKGATYCFMTFSVNGNSGNVNDNLILFTSAAIGAGDASVFSEKPRVDKGFIFPMVYVDAMADARPLGTLPGGFNQTFVDWDENIEYQVIARNADVIFDVIEATDAVVLNVYAYDFDVDAVTPTESHYFDIIRPDKGGDGTFVAEPNGDSKSSSASVGFGMGLTAVVSFGSLFYGMIMLV